MRDGSTSFPYTEFGKDDARISQGTIVSNKLLNGALEHIKQQQAIKDAEKLSGLRTLREKTLLLKRTADLR